MNNKFWIVIIILLLVSVITSNSVNADDVLVRVEIFGKINPQRTWNIPGTLDIAYTWQFEKQKYTTLIAIDEQWYNRIRNQKKKRRYNHKHFAPMVYKGRDTLERLIIEFKRIIPTTWTAEKKINFVLAFVQTIGYEDDKMTGYGEYYKYATETLVEGKGDCEDTSILFASIISGLDFQSALLVLPRHLAVGIKGNFGNQGFWYTNSNKNDRYYHCETTNPKFKLGTIPDQYSTGNVTAEVIRITSNPVRPELVRPQNVPPKVKPPQIPSSQSALKTGIELYKATRYNEAIKSLQLALHRFNTPNKQAEIYFYLGAAEMGFGKPISDVKRRFQEALRKKIDQELPWPDHAKFKPLFEEVRRESIGTLIISASLPYTEIWIYENRTNKKKLGTADRSITLSVFKGTYTIEGIYKDVSKKQKVVIVPNTSKELEIEMPPFTKHTPVSKVSVGEISSLTLNLTSRKKPDQVKVYYTTYDKNKNELERNNKRMLLSYWDRKLLIWTYKVNLPAQYSGGYIRYYIRAEYENRIVVRHPINRYTYHQISIIDDEPIDNKSPTIVLRNIPDSVNDNQEISIKAKVTDDTAVKSVYLFYGYSQSRFSEPSKYNQRILTNTYSDIYTGRISPQDNSRSVWYYLTATDREGNEGKTAKRKIKIKSIHRYNQPPQIILQDTIRFVEVNQRIPIKAKVIDDTDVKLVYLFYGFSKSRITEPLKYYMKPLRKNTLDIYTGYISPQDDSGYVWYYLTAIDREKKKNESEKKVIEIKFHPQRTAPGKPAVVNIPIVHQEIWANYALSSRIGDAISFTYHRNSKNYQKYGFQLDYSYQNPTNMSATAQWEKSMGKSPIVFTLLGGGATYKNFDSTKIYPTMSRQDSNESIYFTPLLGAGLKLYPLDKIKIDVTGLVKIPAKFDTTFLYHYEIGASIYITDLLNLRIGFNQRFLGSNNIGRIQIGFGYTF
ncbi:hypothetical protein JT359_18130 [Candidatus Poribacteria bacterium]|nr:hypothetical protein [Candidatus Poribacteria bacterium]